MEATERARLPLWAIGGLVAALTALQMVRRPSAPPVWDSLIAEDGKIFLSQALSQHFVDSLGTSYQGYLHTVPRVIAVRSTDTYRGDDWIGMKMRDASVVRGIGVLPVFAGLIGLLLLVGSLAATWAREGR